MKKLLLLEDIANVGRKGDLVTVKPGYSRNFLVPQKKAMIADGNVIKIQARLKEERAKQALVDRKESEELSAILAQKVIVSKVNVDPDGNMYGSVTAKNIVDLLAEEGITVERRMVSLTQSIRTIGSHTVHLKLKEGVTAQFTLQIESDREGLRLTEEPVEKQEEEQVE